MLYGESASASVSPNPVINVDIPWEGYGVLNLPDSQVHAQTLKLLFMSRSGLLSLVLLQLWH